jgi:hypothetical protein
VGSQGFRNHRSFFGQRFCPNGDGGKRRERQRARAHQAGRSAATIHARAPISQTARCLGASSRCRQRNEAAPPGRGALRHVKAGAQIKHAPRRGITAGGAAKPDGGGRGLPFRPARSLLQVRGFATLVDEINQWEISIQLRRYTPLLVRSFESFPGKQQYMRIHASSRERSYWLPYTDEFGLEVR